MMRVEEALEALRSRLRPLGREEVPLRQISGRVLREQVVAPWPLPRFASSSMDGFALPRMGIGEPPVRLPVAGESRAGGEVPLPLAGGFAVRIMTGAMVPPGTEAVVQREWCREENGEVVVERLPRRGQNIRPAGAERREGESVLPAGIRLGPAEVALLASLGRVAAQVGRRPRVAILATGDELVEPGAPLPPGRIYDSNSTMLAAAVEAEGGEVVSVVRAPDETAALHSLLDRLVGSDLVLSSGGVSVGDYDLVRDLIRREGTLEFWQVFMKPGKPLAFGRVRDIPFLGLPGNPVSSWVTFRLFARPLLWHLQGRRAIAPLRLVVTLGQDFPEIASRPHYVRVRLEEGDDGLLAIPTGPQASHFLTSLLGAQGLMRVEAGAGPLHRGDAVEVYLLGVDSEGETPVDGISDI